VSGRVIERALGREVNHEVVLVVEDVDHATDEVHE